MFDALVTGGQRLLWFSPRRPFSPPQPSFGVWRAVPRPQVAREGAAGVGGRRSGPCGSALGGGAGDRAAAGLGAQLAKPRLRVALR